VGASKAPEVERAVADDFVERLKTTSHRREAMAQRLSTPKVANLGDQVVLRSGHTYSVELPKTVDPISGNAQASAMLLSSPGFTSTGFLPSYSMRPGDANRTLEVGFSPEARGNYSADVNFVATWGDGHVEEVKVPVRAKAIEITDPRPGFIRDAPAAGSPEVTPVAVENGGADKAVTLGYDTAKSDLNTAIESVFNAQARGVAIVQAEQAKFVKPPVPLAKPLWMDLLEIAIEMGLAVVSERLGAVLSHQLESMLTKEVADKHQVLLKAFEKAVETGIERSVKATKIFEVAVEPGAKSENQLEARERDDENAASPADGAKLSGDEEIQFFTEQVLAVENARDAAKENVNHAIANLAGHLGPSAPAVMTAISSTKSGIAAVKPTVTQAQSIATTTQFMTYLARSQLHTVTAPTANGGHLTTTMMADVRALNRPQHYGQGDSADGLLTLHVVKRNDGYVVSAAGVSGVAQAVTDRLLKVDLKAARMPMVILFDDYGESSITIDEAGRVRSGGVPIERNRQPGYYSEEQDARAVTLLVEQVLGRTLSQHGLEKIYTNDKGGKSE
jgi:hypothetical protein